MLERIQTIFREVFDDDSLVLNDQMSQDTMADWDSFSQVKIMIGMEEEFGVKFTTEEVLEAHSVGAIRGLLARKGVPA